MAALVLSPRYLVGSNGELPGSVVDVFVFLCQLGVAYGYVVIVKTQRPVLVNAVPEDTKGKKEGVLIATRVPDPWREEVYHTSAWCMITGIRMHTTQST